MQKKKEIRGRSKYLWNVETHFDEEDEDSADN